MEGPEITFLFQFGNLRDMVTVSAPSITLKSLKDLACDFINAKVNVTINNEHGAVYEKRFFSHPSIDSRKRYEPFGGAFAIIST